MTLRHEVFGGGGGGIGFVRLVGVTAAVGFFTIVDDVNVKEEEDVGVPARWVKVGTDGWLPFRIVMGMVSDEVGTTTIIEPEIYSIKHWIKAPFLEGSMSKRLLPEPRAGPVGRPSVGIGSGGQSDS